jgi:hypothetical protein
MTDDLSNDSERVVTEQDGGRCAKQGGIYELE